MKQIVMEKNNSSDGFLYEQLYLNIKKQIMEGDMYPGEKCPSLRSLAENLSISVTTVMQAYNQLTAEGYIKNKPGSGYYVESSLNSSNNDSVSKELFIDTEEFVNNKSDFIVDEEAFDFNRWKKCAAKIYTEYSESLLSGSDLKGELLLRNEIAKYLFRSRGVSADPNNIIIAAGTQQSILHLSRVLKKTGIKLIAMETPGYSPVKAMFTDAQFNVAEIPVTESGISINMLPSNISSAAYVNPSNQFPTGVVMPAAKRNEILKWAEDNNSFIIEDDYNSELRYFGKPLPTIKSLDTKDRVIYLGSFSSTLFSAIKISYMVLPEDLSKIFDEFRGQYSQTCSKAEQLTLAYYMSMNYYYTAIRKKRALYTKKLKALKDAFDKYKYDGIELINTNSGLFVTIRINSDRDASEYIEVAKRLGVYATYIEEISNPTQICISMYYSYIPLGSIELITNILINKWRSL
ncbi:MAG: PLP-dependent aminotransferase family protein [Lachnospiraceae bacterium]|nr:PLP-dependent aminotransferase family protein [Lachnospiraceae bacterium]